MERIFDNQKDELKNLILTMGGSVEQALADALTALQKRSSDSFLNVHQLEVTINEVHVKVDNFCVNYLAKQTPVARDLRLIVSIIKMNSDLERMGDQCVNIAHSGREYLARSTTLSQISEIQKMAIDVRAMVRACLDCFVNGDAEAAQRVLLMDDGVDALKHKIFRELSEHMKSHPADVDASLDLILIARNLERLGDHATNIAEDVIFASTGKDVRHGGKYSPA